MAFKQAYASLGFWFPLDFVVVVKLLFASMALVFWI
jgi:hypothetical protein